MTPSAAPFTDYLVWDVARVAVIPLALLLCALVLRLTMHRVQRRWSDPAAYEQQTHPAVMLSYALCLLFIAVRRTDNLGTPFSWYLIPDLGILALGYIGVLKRVHLNIRAPWSRHQ